MTKHMLTPANAIHEIIRICKEVKEQLWGGEFWSDGYFVKTISKFGDKITISRYEKEHGLAKKYSSGQFIFTTCFLKKVGIIYIQWTRTIFKGTFD